MKSYAISLAFNAFFSGANLVLGVVYSSAICYFVGCLGLLMTVILVAQAD